MKKKTRYLLVGMILILFLSKTFTVNATQVKTSTFTINKFDYTITKTATSKKAGTVSVRINQQVKKLVTNIKIPQIVDYKNRSYQVTRIEKSAFSHCINLTNIIIPDSIASINGYAFEGCSSQLLISCSENSKAYKFAKITGIGFELINIKEEYKDENNKKKLIIVGDSRTNNMRKWVKTSVSTHFVAKSGQGYLWFCKEGINQVNAIINPGDVIIIWLGVNDYYSNALGDNSWNAYADKINNLSVNEWSGCKVYVSSVGYVDSGKMLAYYGTSIRSNISQLSSGNNINGIREFNENLKESLDEHIEWINVHKTIGINHNDYENTIDDIWFTRENGMKDGLHYGISKTQEIYNYFVTRTMSN